MICLPIKHSSVDQLPVNRLRMKFLIAAGFLVLFGAAVQSADTKSRNEEIYDSELGYEDENSNFVEWSEGYVFEDDNGNLIEARSDLDEEEDETVDETQGDLPNRVFFYLYTQNNTDTPDQIYVDDANALANSNWDSKKPTRIITHGWINSYESEACTLVRDAYLAHGDYNVIVVDWGSIAKRPYTFASRRVFIVGGYVARLIDFLETQGLDLSELLLVGHSLGGHIVGLAGHQTTNTVGYIVGLDPAAPYFWFSGPGSRISKSDATYVQIIHTNAGKLGYSGEMGDIDFYPNGGSSQNGCSLDTTGACSHARAYGYFAESILNDVEFLGSQCGSWRNWRRGNCADGNVAYMGGSTPTTTTVSGSYYLETNSASPYALG